MTNITPSYEAAHAFAAFALKGKKDKIGAPLIAHAKRMGENFTRHPSTFPYGAEPAEPAKVLSILHDVIEDSDAEIEWDSPSIRLGGLRLDIPRHLAEALDAITRRDGEVYADYIERVREDRLAALVKFHDLSDHLKYAGPAKLPESLIKRYTKARARLLRPLRFDR